MEFLVTSKVADGDNMGVFENSFYLSNYENCNLALRYKKPNEDDGNKDEDKDDRIKRDTKRIDKYTITCEDSAALQSEDAKFQKACALSTEVARNLCNTRASTATPGWMEQQVRELVKGYKGVKEVRVL